MESGEWKVENGLTHHTTRFAFSILNSPFSIHQINSPMSVAEVQEVTFTFT